MDEVAVPVFFLSVTAKGNRARILQDILYDILYMDLDLNYTKK